MALGDTDSSFPLLANIRVHVKSCLGRGCSLSSVPASGSSQQQGNGSNIQVGAAAEAGQPQHNSSNQPLLALHCYHGFGANLYSWGACQKRLVSAAFFVFYSLCNTALCIPRAC